MNSWMKDDLDTGHAIVSSRVRLARNLMDYPFSNKLKDNEAREIINLVSKTIREGDSILRDDFELYSMSEMSELDKAILVEKHLISKELADDKKSAALIKKDETVSIMINEEDHLRIQTIFPGFKVDDAWELADKIDDVLEESLRYAFDERLGYLTACPTNVGTGMRASVMLHLPALVELGYIEGVLRAANQIGLAVRGIYGEGTQALGNIFQISNQLTLGRKEDEILANVMGISKQMVDKEMEARKFLQNRLGFSLEDRIYRALSLLKGARMMDSLEAMSHLSDLKMGVSMGYIKGLTHEQLDKMMVEIQPGFQQKIYTSHDVKERDKNRSEFLRKEFKSIEI